MATLAERVLALTGQGYNFPTIAAILDLSAHEVEEVWEGQSLQREAPPAFLAWLAVECRGGKAAGADQQLWMPSTWRGPQTAAMTPELLSMSGGIKFSVRAPQFTEGAFEAEQVIASVSNADGTEKLVMFGEKFSLEGNESLTFDMRGWSVEEEAGEDLSLSENGEEVGSAAGGQYMASLYVEFNAVGLA